MVTSPKTGRELHAQRLYKGPPWVARLVRKYLGATENNQREDRDTP